MHAFVLGAAAEGNPRALIGVAVGLLIVILSGPVSRLVGRLNKSLSRSPASAISPLLNKERQDATQAWLREGGETEPARYLLIFGGLLFMAASTLLFLGVIT
jgi:hypothetical protein